MSYKYRDRHPEKIKKQVVESILSGVLLLEEAMSKYKILSKRTVIRWLKQHHQENGERRIT